MTPKFAAVVDPFILAVLDLQKRISVDSSVIEPDFEHQQLCDRINEADARMGDSDDWQLAKYALVAWTDDVMIDTPWEGSQWWRMKPLEVQFFGSRQAYSRFFEQARQAESLSKKDAVEVFYVCVVLGFRGLYRPPVSTDETDQLGLPADLSTWARGISRSIQLTQIKRIPGDKADEHEIASGLMGRYRLLMSVVLASALGMILFFLWLSFHVYAS